jgi:hypothetical protein
MLDLEIAHYVESACVSPEWAERVTLERVSDHFIFSVESTGALAS